MRTLILLLLTTASIYADACTAKTGGSAASPLLWSSASNWTGCTTGGAHYPGQNSVDTAVIPAGANISADVNVTIGNSGQPYYYYPYLTGNGGSGFTVQHPSVCGGGLTSGSTTPYRAASILCMVINGALQLVLWDHGYYTTSTMPSLSAVTPLGNTVFAASSARNSNPVRFGIVNTNAGGADVSSTGWAAGSSQVVKISGFTGNWASLNGTRTLTVVSDDIRYGAVVSVAGMDSTSWGPATGAPTIASPSAAYNSETGSPTWAIATMAGGGTPAIQINHVNANSGTLTIAANVILTVRGDIVHTGTYPDATTAIVQKRGSHLMFDNSLYAGSPKPEYGVVQGTGSGSMILYDASDCANAVRAGTDMAAHAGECWISAPGGITGMAVNLQNVFVNSGSADAPAIAAGANNSNTAGITAYNSWFDQSGTLSNTGEYHNGANERATMIDLQGNAFTRPLNPMPVLTIAGVTSGGPRTIKYNYIDGSLNYPVGFSTQFGGAVTNNFIGSGIYAVSYAGYSLTDNIVRLDVSSPGVNTYGSITPNADHNMVWQDMDKALNQRWIGCAPGIANISGWIGHFTGFHWGDPGEIGCSLNYSLFLPDGTGFVGSRLESMVNSAGPPEVFTHNTTSADSVNAGTMDAGEGGQNTLHPLTFKSNLMWLPSWADHQDNPGDHRWYKISCSTATTTDICTTTSATVSNCDYNSGNGSLANQTDAGGPCGAGGASCVNQGRSYLCSWSYTPGSHDIDTVPPYFVDESRNLLWYDIGMGAPLAPAWNSTATYHFGDKASDAYQDASVPVNYYNGKRFNYVCKVSDCSGAPEPGRLDSGTSWRQYWIFGGQWQLLQDTLAHGNSLWNSDSSLWGHFAAGTGPHSQCTVAAPCSTTQAAMGWILAGFRPRQPALLTAGHDGTTIGAMPGAPMCRSSAVGGVAGAIGRGCNAVMQ